MIGHFLEVWGLLLVAFVAGCVLGTLAYMAIAASPWAHVQIETADAIGDTLGSLRLRLRGGARTGRSRSATSAPPLPPASAPRRSGYFEEEDWNDRQPETTEPLAAPLAHDDATATNETDWDVEPYGEDVEPEHLNAEVPLPDPALPDEEPIPLPPTLIDPPAPAPPIEPVPDLPAMRPLTLPGPRNGVPDDLQRIRGIGQKNEELLNSLGIYHFGQIAAWTPAEARWVAAQLAFPDRIERDDWVGQAIILATGGDTGYVKGGSRRKGEETVVA